MKSYKLKPLLIAVCYAVTALWTETQGAEEIIPEAEEIRNIYAFHAAYNLPLDGKMIPGKANNGSIEGMGIKGEPLQGVAGWRPTLHFSLASICPDSAQNTLSNRNHVIIVKIRDLESQLVGLQPFDSFIIGDFFVPHGSSVIVPADEEEITKQYEWVQSRNIQVIPRDSNSLMNQVQKFLLTQEGWIFKGDDEKKAPTGLKRQLKTNNEKLKINNVPAITQSFFSRFLEEAPHVNYASHCRHHLGFLDSNAKYLFCKRKKMDIIGHATISELFDNISSGYIDALRRNHKGELAEVLEKKIELLKKEVFQNKQQKEKIQELYFGDDEKELQNYAITWIAKGKYLHNKTIKKINLGIVAQSEEAVRDYLKEIGMISGEETQ